MVGAFLAWWYGQGWRGQFELVSQRLAKLVDLFSMPVLVRTFFAPFRQIGVGGVGGSLDMKLQAWADKMFSRIVGAFVRLCTLIVGSIVVICVAALGVVQLLGWILLPVVPVAGIVLTVMGWLPWKN